VKAVGQHGFGESKGMSPRVSALAIPWKRVALYATLAIGFFLLGFVPTWFKASRAIEQRDAAQRGVRLAQLEDTLAAAVIDVQRGQYEPARQLTSDFYTSVRRQVDAANASHFTPAQREGLRSLLAERDELITLLARSDPTAADRLLNVYSTYNKLANHAVSRETSFAARHNNTSEWTTPVWKFQFFCQLLINTGEGRARIEHEVVRPLSI
jgi:hypothetical protein